MSGDAWPNGTRFHTVRTTTDEQGVAQVQWTLGTHLELTTQRVEARLLDRSGSRGDQAALFIAQLALAGEITWRPLVPWRVAALLTGASATVQGAIDAIAQRVETLAGTARSFDPFVGAQWRATSGQLSAARPDHHHSPDSSFAAVVFRPDLVPRRPRHHRRDAARGGARLCGAAGHERRAGGGRQRYGRLFRQVVRRWEWMLSSQGRGAINRALAAAGGKRPVPLVVTVLAAMAARGAAGENSSARHELLFHMQ